MNRQIRDLMPWSRGRKAVAGEAENPFLDLQRGINRVFDDFWSRSDDMLAPLGEGFATAPAADMAETDKAVEVSVELPGMDEKDVEVGLEDGVLTVSGEKKAEKKENRKGCYLSERSYGSFERRIGLPDGIEADKAEAVFKNGVLTVTLPKTAAAQKNAKRIAIRSA